MNKIIIKKFKQNINGISEKKYSLDKLKKICPESKRDWYEVTTTMLDYIKSYYKRGPQKTLCENIKNLKVSQFGQFKIEYTNGKIEDLIIEDLNLKIGSERFTDLTTYNVAANAFLGDKKKCEKGIPYETHHIDNCEFHNTPENLIYLKFCEHKYVGRENRTKNECNNCENCWW
ncbi:hypothetical protein IJ541_08010 [bacterium]|nr:hypothetical protein [bacterium]